MTTEHSCAACGGPATLMKTLPLCSRCGLKISEEALGFVFDGMRGDATVLELPAAPAPRMSPAEADDVAHQRLGMLRRQGAKRVTFKDFRELMEVTGRSRPWVYRWLDARVKDGDLVKDESQDTLGYTLTY